MKAKTKTTATKEEATPALVPKLRFPEFRDAEGWEPKRLGLALKFQAGFPFPSSGFNDAGKGLRLIRNRDLRSDDIVKFYSDDFDPNFVVNNGDVLVGMDGDFTPTVWEKGEALLNQRVGRILPRGDNDHRFLLYLLTLCLKGIEEATARTTVKHLSHSAVEDKHEPLPSPAEQQKVAECLSSVDELMAAQARKVDALKTHKKGLMQQLFPREGETQPRVRFAEFQNAGEWEPETLENVCAAKISYGIVQAGPHVPNGMPYIKSTDLNSELCLANMARTSEAIAQKYRRSEVVPGDIVFSLRGNIGVAQILPEGIPVANLTQGTARIRTKGPPEFYFHALRSPSVNGRIQAVGKGSTFQEISLEALRNIRLFHPKPAEQQRIASCLSSLDTLITAETQKHEALKTHKKGLMQKLFPSPEKVEPCKR
jgi:type I restriction enzyme S subunit